MSKEKKQSWSYFLGTLVSFLIIHSLLFPDVAGYKELTYNEFVKAVNEKKVARLVIFQDKIVGEFKNDKDSASAVMTDAPSAPWRVQIPSIENQVRRQFTVSRIPAIEDENLLPQLIESGIDFKGKFETNSLRNFLLNTLFPLIIFFALWFLLLKKTSAGHPMLDLGRNKAKIVAQKSKEAIRFADVAGVDEAVDEVKELVEFLKYPKKYTELGGKLPKGILLVGPPGTGKTLLAKAVAGEAGVPFFSLSGSDFVEMFVGVGAARVRDLFDQAKKNAPCIIFIDEIDAIGKSRARNAIYSGGYDERENTLNQLLVEMDGFDPGAGVIMMGATNRPDVLDPALLRPGRFDRQVLVDKPDMKGREAIFKVHTRKLKLDSAVDLSRLAAQTPGFAGAEIANVCNEAAILAVRNKHKQVTLSDFEEAIERVIAGLEKKNKIISEKERKIVAYHEAGHAIVGYFTPGADEVQKVSIVPRGFGALGYTLQMPLEDRYLMSKSELSGKMKGLLGGRAAEEIIFGEVSTGASNDLEKVMQLAKNMVTVYGMSDKLPNLSLVNRTGMNFLSNGSALERRSEHIEKLIDEEVSTIINQCYMDAKELLFQKREQLEKLANTLLEKEVLSYDEMKQLLGEKVRRNENILHPMNN
jgi:cell division protease FtsH